MPNKNELSEEWIEFDGDYEKEIQDIKLENGDIVTECWPNAGFWRTLTKDGNEKYYGKNIPATDAKYVRLTHENHE